MHIKKCINAGKWQTGYGSSGEYNIFSISSSRIVIIAFLLLLPVITIAEDEEPVPKTTVVSGKFKPPEPIKRTNPDYPKEALISAKEGWVILSYTIATDGTVIEPMIEDSSGNEKMERASLRAVKNWEYSPAMENGIPVEQSMTKLRLVFHLGKDSIKGARGLFISKYRKISKLIEERKLDEAEPLLTELQYGEKQNLYEDAWFWWLRYVYLDAQGSVDNEEKENCLTKAIGYEVDYLPPDIFVAATQALYKLYVETTDLGYAIETYERLLNSKTAKRSRYYKDALAAMEAHVQKLRELIAVNNILNYKARIGDHDYWTHPLIRRSFSIDGINGIVKLVDIRCTNHTERYPLSETNTWELPDEWGECTLYVKGDQGTTFNFYEFHSTVTVSN